MEVIGSCSAPAPMQCHPLFYDSLRLRFPPGLAVRSRAVRRVVAAVVQRVLGLLVGMAEGLILTFYTYLVEPAPSGSWPTRVFTWLATGKSGARWPLRASSKTDAGGLNCCGRAA